MTRLKLSLLLVAAPAATASCQMIAGIEDLQLTSSAGASSDGSTSDDSQLDGGFTVEASSPDAAAEGAPAVDAAALDGADAPDTSGMADAADGASSADGRDADGGTADHLAGDGGAADAGLDARDAAADGGDGAIPTELIDDLESDDGHIIPTHGRSGSWYTYGDGTDGGVLAPRPGAPFLPAPTMPALGSSRYSAEATASGFTTFAGMGFNLNSPPTGPDAGSVAAYDVSAYVGVVFYARVGASSLTRVRIGLPDANTQANGNSFGEFLTLTSQWTEEVVYFADLHQENYGPPQFAALDAKHVYSINFQVDASGGSATFDLWVDNISFITR